MARRRNPVSRNMALLIGVGVAALAGGAVILATKSSTAATPAPAAKPTTTAWTTQTVSLQAGSSPTVPHFLGQLQVTLPSGANWPPAGQPLQTVQQASFVQMASDATSITFVIPNITGTITLNWVDSSGKMQTTQITVS